MNLHALRVRPQGHTDNDFISTAFRDLLMRSYDQICYTMPDREYEMPLSRKEKTDLLSAIQRETSRIGINPIFNIVNQAIQNYMRDYLLTKFRKEKGYSRFFSLCISLDNYLDHLTEWLNTLLVVLIEDQNNYMIGALLCKTAYFEVHSNFSDEIYKFFHERNRRIRKNHSYLSGWAFRGLYHDRFLKMITTLYMLYDPLERVHNWQHEYYCIVRTHISRTFTHLPPMTDLREFLAISTAVWNQEWHLYTTIFENHYYDKAHIKSNILYPIHKNFDKRARTSYHYFFSSAKLIKADDNTFDARLLADLFLVISHRDLCFDKELQKLKQDLRAHYRRNCLKKVEALFSEKVGSPQWNFGTIMESYWNTSHSYTRKWRNAIEGSVRRYHLIQIKEAFSEGIFELITKKEANENIEKISIAIAEFICGMRGPRQRGMEADHIIDFYHSISNKESLKNHIVETLMHNIASGTGNSPFHSIYTICKEFRDSRFTNELKGVVRFGKEGQKVSQYLNRNSEGAAENGTSRVTITGTIVPEKYRPEYEANLLRKPKELMDIDKRFASQSMSQAHLRREERVSVQNAKSGLNITTKMFSTNNEPINLTVTVYQYCILRCLQRNPEITVKDICSTLTRPNLSVRDDKLRARKVVKLVLMSMTQPYQLLKIVSKGPRRASKEIRPSKAEAISGRHHILLNKELSSDSDPLELPQPDLRIDYLDEMNEMTEDDEQERQAQAPRRRNPTLMRVAERSVFGSVRTGCAQSESNLIDENQLIDDVCNRVRAYGVIRQDILDALEGHIQAGVIQRHMQGNANMLRFIGRNDED